MHNKHKHYIASLSCDKDIMAMVSDLIIENYLIDEILFHDIGMELQAIYDNWLIKKKRSIFDLKNRFKYDFILKHIIR